MFPKLTALIEYLDSLEGRADLVILERLLGELAPTIERSDIEAACVFSQQAYRRNRIAESKWYELLAICWHSGQRTPIHDHVGSSCAFLVVEGVVTETRFERTSAGVICPTFSHRLEPGTLCAAEDDDIHQVTNAEPPGTDVVTLHIYSPPLHRMNRYSIDVAGVMPHYETNEPLVHGAGI
jgi:cysteine dioxygenase